LADVAAKRAVETGRRSRKMRWRVASAGMAGVAAGLWIISVRHNDPFVLVTAVLSVLFAILFALYESE
jgi:hypothetical protein